MTAVKSRVSILVVEVAADAAAGVFACGAPCVFGTHVCREAEKGWRRSRLGKGEAPDPGIVRRGAVEAVRGVFPLLLRQPVQRWR